ncbi:hypothetical protein LNQ03_32410 [Klebsiella pneumoniae subsp. pneumoniae]|nr:hypothetical protein [Klebsiella pneumoniae subsp. pneumoniae]
MFSLPEPRTVDPASGGGYLACGPASSPDAARHLAGIVDDCRRLRGHHVGMAWERGLACGLLAILGLWGGGTAALLLPLITVRLLQSREKPATRPTPPFLTIN